jgi:hypothetical protein
MMRYMCECKCVCKVVWPVYSMTEVHLLRSVTVPR